MIWRAVLLSLWTAPAAADITAAHYAEPTTRYAHGILGDAVEWGALVIETEDGRLLFRLPETRVFEDTAPRLADLDGDGDLEVITVETDLSRGASLSIWDEAGRVAATPFIGQPTRWLAPAGAADLDRDGRVEIAYIDRPHLLKRLRIVRLEQGRLAEVASLDGVTNHRIGDKDISGGVRDCGGGPELVLLSADWSRVVAVTLPGPALRDLGANTSGRLAAALACRD